MKRNTKVLHLLFSLSTLLFFQNLLSQGNLLITPRRVIFDNAKRSQEINLANIGKDSATYVISMIQVRMKEDGGFENIITPDSGQQFADKNLRFFPRSVTLAPNEAQTVKIQLIKSGELTPGEYRSHFYFRALPKEKPLGEVAPKKDSVFSIKLNPVFGISIPVIIRSGETSASVQMSDAAFDVENDTIPFVRMTFNRSGNMSVYGDISIDHISGYGKVTRVADVKGVAVYTPNSKRNLKILLNKYAGADLAGGKLKIIYSDQLSKNKILAQEEISLN